MFVVHCPQHGGKVLLGLSRIRRMVNLRGLIVVELECHDGARILHVTGRRAHELRRPAAAPAPLDVGV